MVDVTVVETTDGATIRRHGPTSLIPGGIGSGWPNLPSGWTRRTHHLLPARVAMMVARGGRKYGRKYGCKDMEESENGDSGGFCENGVNFSEIAERDQGTFATTSRTQSERCTGALEECPDRVENAASLMFPERLQIRKSKTAIHQDTGNLVAHQRVRNRKMFATIFADLFATMLQPLYNHCPGCSTTGRLSG